MGRSSLRYRRIFLEANGPGPWPCSECDELVFKIGKRARDGHIHHLDGDETHDVAKNLTIAHAGCHMRKHLKGVPHSAEHSAKVGRKGRVFTDEHRQHICESWVRRKAAS